MGLRVKYRQSYYLLAFKAFASFFFWPTFNQVITIQIIFRLKHISFIQKVNCCIFSHVSECSANHSLINVSYNTKYWKLIFCNRQRNGWSELINWNVFNTTLRDWEDSMMEEKKPPKYNWKNKKNCQNFKLQTVFSFIQNE